MIHPNPLRQLPVSCEEPEPYSKKDDDITNTSVSALRSLYMLLCPEQENFNLSTEALLRKCLNPTKNHQDPHLEWKQKLIEGASTIEHCWCLKNKIKYKRRGDVWISDFTLEKQRIQCQVGRDLTQNEELSQQKQEEMLHPRPRTITILPSNYS